MISVRELKEWLEDIPDDWGFSVDTDEEGWGFHTVWVEDIGKPGTFKSLDVW